MCEPEDRRQKYVVSTRSENQGRTFNKKRVDGRTSDGIKTVTKGVLSEEVTAGRNNGRKKTLKVGV